MLNLGVLRMELTPHPQMAHKVLEYDSLTQDIAQGYTPIDLLRGVDFERMKKEDGKANLRRR